MKKKNFLRQQNSYFLSLKMAHNTAETRIEIHDRILWSCRRLATDSLLPAIYSLANRGREQKYVNKWTNKIDRKTSENKINIIFGRLAKASVAVLTVCCRTALCTMSSCACRDCDCIIFQMLFLWFLFIFICFYSTWNTEHAHEFKWTNESKTKKNRRKTEIKQFDFDVVNLAQISFAAKFNWEASFSSGFLLFFLFLAPRFAINEHTNSVTKKVTTKQTK